MRTRVTTEWHYNALQAKLSRQEKLIKRLREALAKYANTGVWQRKYNRYECELNWEVAEQALALKAEDMG